MECVFHCFTLCMINLLMSYSKVFYMCMTVNNQVIVMIEI